MTRTELISAYWTHCVFQRFFFISLYNFNQLDATSKVMYRHEIMCTGNKAYLINNYLFRDNAVALVALIVGCHRVPSLARNVFYCTLMI